MFSLLSIVLILGEKKTVRFLLTLQLFENWREREFAFSFVASMVLGIFLEIPLLVTWVFVETLLLTSGFDARLDTRSDQWVWYCVLPCWVTIVAILIKLPH